MQEQLVYLACGKSQEPLKTFRQQRAMVAASPCGELGTGTYPGVSTVTAMITGAVLSGPFTNSIFVIFAGRCGSIAR